MSIPYRVTVDSPRADAGRIHVKTSQFFANFLVTSGFLLSLQSIFRMAVVPVACLDGEMPDFDVCL